MDSVIKFALGAGGAWVLENLTFPEILRQMAYAELEHAYGDPEFVEWLENFEWAKKAKTLPVEQLLGLNYDGYQL